MHLTPNSPAVLLTVEHDKLAMLIASDLAAHGVRVEAVARSIPATLKKCRHISRFHEVAEPIGSEQFVARIIGIMRKRGISMLIPSCREIEHLAPYQELLSREANYIFLSQKMLDLVDDKFRLKAVAGQFNISTPAAILVESTIRPSELNSLRFPVIIKPIRGRSQNHNAIAATPAELPRLIERIQSQHDGALMVEEVVDGNLLSWTGVRWDGAIQASYLFEAVLLSPAFAGSAVVRRSLHLPELEDLVESLLSGLDYNGILNLDFIWDSSAERYQLLDFNPRFGTSLHAPLAAGVSLPWILFQLAHGEKVARPEYDDGKISLAFWGLVHRVLARTVYDPPRARLLMDSLHWLPAVRHSEEWYLGQYLPMVNRPNALNADPRLPEDKAAAA